MNRLTGRIAWAGAVLGLLATAGPGGFTEAWAGRTVVLDEVQIAVNDKVLTRREVEDLRRIQTQELRQQFKGEELEAKLRTLNADLTERLVEDLMLESHAERLGIQIQDSVIEERVDNILRRQPNLQELYSDEQLKSFVVKDLLRRQVLTREVDSQVRVTDAEIQVACRSEQSDQREVDVGHILLRDDAPDVRQRMEALRSQLLAGGDFEAMAQQHSQDPSVKTNKGRLGFIGRGQFVKPFEKAAFALPVGAVSDPVRTQFGWHLVKIFGQRSKGALNCDALEPVARQALENRLYARKRELRLVTFLARLKKAAAIRVATTP